MSRELADRYVDSLLGAPGERGYRRLTRDASQAVQIPDLLYRYELWDRFNQPITLTLYLGVGGLGELLWDQELRTLERVAGLDHPALPPLIDGGRLAGLDGDVGAAYIRTQRRGTPAASSDNRALLRANRGQALPHLWLLADALAVLTGANISHRGLWPGALTVSLNDDEELQSVRLARFEMSALLANLFRLRESSASHQQLRDYYRRDDPVSLLYAPPERLDFIFSRPSGDLGGPAGDVFSLGMVAADWFLGEDLFSDPPTTREGIAARQDEVRRALTTRGRELPGKLVEAFRSMLDPRPGERATAFEVARDLSAGYAEARAVLDMNLPELPYLVGVMPDQTDQTLLKWGFVQDSAMTAEGLDQLVDLVSADMRGAEVVHSPEGADGFAYGSSEKLKRAKTVIIGPQITWFCERLWIGRHEFHEMMVVKFVRRSSDIAAMIDRLRVTGLVRRIPMVDAEVMPNDSEIAQEICSGRPDWRHLVERVESGRTLAEAEREYLSSMEWYLQYQQALLEARTYAYELEPVRNGHPGTATLRWSPLDDRARKVKFNQPLSLRAVQDTRRPELAPFVRDAIEGADYTRLRITSRESQDWAKADAYEVVNVLDPDTVIVSVRDRHQPPEKGWLRLDSDAGTEVQIRRQMEATRELAENRILLNQLITPRNSIHEVSRWMDAGGRLKGEGQLAVREILVHQGLFALQGPPGTGKTEVTSEAVAEYLRSEPGARVLVSAQSHDALENLAIRVCRKLGITAPPGSGRPQGLDWIALRVSSRRADRDPNPELATLRPADLAERVVAVSTERARDWLRTRRSEEPALVPVLQEWIRRVQSALPELSRRVKSAANVVFATTGVATRDILSAEATDEPFDWVVVEEAGRAWPTELALPLVRGVRWTLIGDHLQIGAYSKADVERFLMDLDNYDDPEVKAMYDNRERHSRNFDTFGRLFDGSVRSAPTKTLSEQYRMDPDISGLVGDTFYSASGGLKALRPRSSHPLDHPEPLRDRRLVWIDTGSVERSVRFWSNEYEAIVCSHLIRHMEPVPGTPDGPSLAVLTPYRDQVRLLQNHLLEHAERIHTVDGFQGREADIVVASLVRDRLASGSSVIQTVGHLAAPERVNVLLSRAREMLVIIGRLQVYKTAAGKEWAAVVERFLRDGVVIPASLWEGN